MHVSSADYSTPVTVICLCSISLLHTVNVVLHHFGLCMMCSTCRQVPLLL